MSHEESPKTFTAFKGTVLVAHGSIEEVVKACKKCHDAGADGRLALYDDATGRAVDIDYRGDEREVLARLGDHPLLVSRVEPGDLPKGPGRPKLGVVSREISLLPRHWEWLGRQSGGASAAIRLLVDKARKENLDIDRLHAARETLHRFMWDLAGDFPRFEEVSRALFADDYKELNRLIEEWPVDVREYVRSSANRLGELQAVAAS